MGDRMDLGMTYCADGEPYQGACYVAKVGAVPIDVARRSCQQQNGHLLTLNSREERRFVEEVILMPNFATLRNMWAGVYLNIDVRDYMWDDNTGWFVFSCGTTLFL